MAPSGRYTRLDRMENCWHHDIREGERGRERYVYMLLGAWQHMSSSTMRQLEQLRLGGDPTRR